MARPTIKDLANEAGVSVSTVNRLIGGQGKVREGTVQRVLEAAKEIGFYGLGALQHRATQQRTRYRFAIILLQSSRSFYQSLGSALKQAAAEHQADVTVSLSFMDDLLPENIASKLEQTGATADGVAVVAAEHPRVTEAIETLHSKGVPVFSLISPLTAGGNAGYIGLDNWKVGRTAAWAFHNICKTPGKIGILIGNYRYRCQELNESGFRSYFREHGKQFSLLEPLTTFESSAAAAEMTEKLLADHPDLRGLYITGGGITGALSALGASGRSGELVTIGYELIEVTKAALLDQTLTMAISHPVERLARETIAAMINAKSVQSTNAMPTVLLPFDINTPENL